MSDILRAWRTWMVNWLDGPFAPIKAAGGEAATSQSSPSWYNSANSMLVTLQELDELMWDGFETVIEGGGLRDDLASDMQVVGFKTVELMKNALHMAWTDCTVYDPDAMRLYGAGLNATALSQLIHSMAKIDGTTIPPAELPVISQVPGWQYFTNPVLGLWTQNAPLSRREDGDTRTAGGPHYGRREEQGTSNDLYGEDESERETACFYEGFDAPGMENANASWVIDWELVFECMLVEVDPVTRLDVGEPLRKITFTVIGQQ